MYAGLDANHLGDGPGPGRHRSFTLTKYTWFIRKDLDPIPPGCRYRLQQVRMLLTLSRCSTNEASNQSGLSKGGNLHTHRMTFAPP